MFLVGFDEGPALVRAVASGNTVQSERVSDHLEMFSVAWRASHGAHESMLWERLVNRAPSSAPHVERMKAQRAEVLAHMNALDEQLPPWRASARTPEAEPLLATLDAINSALAVHLPEVTKFIVPVMETALTEKEADWFADSARKAIPKGLAMIQLGATLAAQPDGGDELLQNNVSAATRLAWRTGGKQKYLRYRSELLSTKGRRATR